MGFICSFFNQSCISIYKSLACGMMLFSPLLAYVQYVWETSLYNLHVSGLLSDCGSSSYISGNDIKVYDLIPILFLTLTLPVIVFCDLSILWTLKRCGPGGRNVDPQKKRALQIIINNFVITLISYLSIIITWLLFQFMNLDENNFTCLVVTPVMCIIVVGNTVSIILHVNNLGKLDWLKDCQQKWTSWNLIYYLIFS